jgi:hypothetical protein
MKQNETNLSLKIPKYNCECCKYITNNKKDYNKHILTAKHQNETFMKQNGPEKSPDMQCNCGLSFNSRTTLWRHKKKCIDINNLNNDTNDTIFDKDLIMMLVKQNTELLEVLKNGTNTTINSNNVNSNNKTFNLQFFLNETCKDAMNIMDFVNSIQLQLSDLESVGKLGFVEGISNIITTNLKALDITQRPVHCTDNKRETIYIKDENKWEKEDDQKVKLRKAIKRVATKNLCLIHKFKEAHPDCNRSSSRFSDQYNKIIIEACGGSGNNDLEKEDKIIRNIAKNVTIDKK